MKKQGTTQAQHATQNAGTDRQRDGALISVPAPSGFVRLSSGILVPAGVLKGVRR